MRLMGCVAMRARTSLNQTKGLPLMRWQQATKLRNTAAALPPISLRKTSSCRGQPPSRIHSAHIGQEVEIHYRWHPLYGQRLRVQHSEQRASGRVIHVEVAPGIVTILPEWMVDASVCAGMALG